MEITMSVFTIITCNIKKNLHSYGSFKNFCLVSYI